MPLTRRCTLLILSSLLVCAQDLTIPKEWNNPVITNTVSERVSLAKGAIDVALQNINPSTGYFNTTDKTSNIGWGPAAVFYTELALFDRYNNGTHRDYYLPTINGIRAANNFVRFTSQAVAGLDLNCLWGLACLEAHLTYGDTEFLALAQNTWNFVNSFVLTQSNIDNQTPPPKARKTLTFIGECETNLDNSITPFEASRAGGAPHDFTFDDAFSALSTGSFAVLSARLAEATSNTTYDDSALTSTKFIANQLLTSNGLVLGSVLFDNCSISDTQNFGPGENGLFVRLASLLDVSDHNVDKRLNQMVESALAQKSWLTSDGVVLSSFSPSNADTTKFRDELLVRGLFDVYMSNKTSDQLKQYVNAFLSVQFNAIRDQAGENDIYSVDWTGPKGSPFTREGQTRALTVLVSAINLPGSSTSSQDPNPTTTTTGSPQASDAADRKSTNVGGIVGGVIGALVALGVIGFLLFFLHRRRQERIRADAEPEQMITPFENVTPMSRRQGQPQAPGGGGGPLPYTSYKTSRGNNVPAESPRLPMSEAYYSESQNPPTVLDPNEGGSQGYNGLEDAPPPRYTRKA